MKVGSSDEGFGLGTMLLYMFSNASVDLLPKQIIAILSFIAISWFCCNWLGINIQHFRCWIIDVRVVLTICTVHTRPLMYYWNNLYCEIYLYLKCILLAYISNKTWHHYYKLAYVSYFAVYSNIIMQSFICQFGFVAKSWPNDTS